MGPSRLRATGSEQITHCAGLNVGVVRQLRTAPRVSVSLDEADGLLDDEAQTHQEIAAWLGVGQARSRQLERQALHWLRELAA
jgi:hypothetical protein